MQAFFTQKYLTRPESTHFWLRTISYIRRKNDTKQEHFTSHFIGRPHRWCHDAKFSNSINVKSPDCVASVRVLFQARPKVCLFSYWTTLRPPAPLCVSSLYPRYDISIVKPTRCTSFSNFLFWNNTLHVSGGLSVHHQEFKNVHTATGICQTHTADCLLAGTRWNCRSISFPLASSQQYVFDVYLLLYV